MNRSLLLILSAQIATGCTMGTPNPMVTQDFFSPPIAKSIVETSLATKCVFEPSLAQGFKINQNYHPKSHSGNYLVRLLDLSENRGIHEGEVISQIEIGIVNTSGSQAHSVIGAHLDAAAASLEAPMIVPFRAGPKVPYTNKNALDELASNNTVTLYSDAKHKQVTFIRSKEILVAIKTIWSMPDTPSPSIATSQNDAVRVFLNAISNPASQSEEEITGKDFFFGFPYRNVIDNLASSLSDVKPIYEVPQMGDVGASLVTLNGKSVWQLTYSLEKENHGDETAMFSGAGIGLVDVATGKLIRFQRPYSANIRPQDTEVTCPDSKAR